MGSIWPLPKCSQRSHAWRIPLGKVEIIGYCIKSNGSLPFKYWLIISEIFDNHIRVIYISLIWVWNYYSRISLGQLFNSPSLCLPISFRVNLPEMTAIVKIPQFTENILDMICQYQDKRPKRSIIISQSNTWVESNHRNHDKHILISAYIYYSTISLKISYPHNARYWPLIVFRSADRMLGLATYNDWHLKGLPAIFKGLTGNLERHHQVIEKNGES